MGPSLGFFSTFAPRLEVRPSRRVQYVCQKNPQTMTLLSHEKLDVVTSSDDGEIANYRLKIEIPGSFSKRKRKDSLQEMRKHANFPGFRKGTIPPFILKDVDGFIFRDSADEMIAEAIKELDMSRYDEEGENIGYDPESLRKRFVVGQDFYFECEIPLTSVRDDEVDVESLNDVVSFDKELIGEVQETDLETLRKDLNQSGSATVDHN